MLKDLEQIFWLKCRALWVESRTDFIEYWSLLARVILEGRTECTHSNCRAEFGCEIQGSFCEDRGLL